MNTTTKNNTITCYHCGDTCLEDSLTYEGKDFCCPGCKLVYELLQENGLSGYYQYGDAPGTKQTKQHAKSNRYDYLLDPETVSRLIDFQNDVETHITFNVPAIHCASCIWLLENLHELHPGIVSGRVDFVKKQAKIKFLHQQVSLRDVVQLLSKIGYEPTIHLADLEEKVQKPNSDKGHIYKLAVAGFCFGNMMFFSLPEYFAEAELLGENFRNVFAYLNIFLALPVVAYSASDYYRSAWYALRNGQVNMDVPIVLGIIALFGYSLYEILILDGTGYLDSLGGLLFFLLIGKIYQQKTFETLSFDRDYKAYFPLAVTRMEKGTEKVVPLPQVKVGETIKVRRDELIPCDSVVLEGDAQIDYSFVTGEEVPVPVQKGQVIYAGGRQKGQEIVLAVQKPPSQGYLTDLWNHGTFQQEEKHSLNTLANAISGKFTLTVLLIAFGALAFWSFSDLSLGIRAFTSVLIIACPCALAMSTPFTLGNTLRIFGRAKFYLKNSQVIEQLAKVDTFIFDKTGTLTDPTRASVEFRGQALSEKLLSAIKTMVAPSTHPLSNRINGWLKVPKSMEVDQVEEIQGEGIRARFLEKEILLGSASWVGAHHQGGIMGGNQVFLSVDGDVLGYFFIQSGLREGVVTLSKELRNIADVHLLSGDNNHERANLEKVLGEEVKMNFRQSPKDKLDYVAGLNKKGKYTLMIGDGLNDAGALRESYVGIALTDQTTHFSPASDAIMDASVLEQLPRFVQFAKTSRQVIKASFALSFAYNAVGLSLAVQGILSPVICAVLMPLSSISVVVFTTLTTNYLAHQHGLKTKAIWK